MRSGRDATETGSVFPSGKAGSFINSNSTVGTFHHLTITLVIGRFFVANGRSLLMMEE
jgi:hypothetical protein